MKYFLILLSAPGFIVVFIWGFIKQSFDDGVVFEKALRDYYKEIED